MEDKLTCIIADDSIFFRSIMKDISEQLDLEILGEFENGNELTDAVYDGVVEHPDLVFLDINMPGMSGKEVLESLMDSTPESVVIMVSTVNDSQTIKECIKIGAGNFINKDTDINKMKEIIVGTMKNNGLI